MVSVRLLEINRSELKRIRSDKRRSSHVSQESVDLSPSFLFLSLSLLAKQNYILSYHYPPSARTRLRKHHQLARMKLDYVVTAAAYGSATLPGAPDQCVSVRYTYLTPLPRRVGPSRPLNHD